MRIILCGSAWLLCAALCSKSVLASNVEKTAILAPVEVDVYSEEDFDKIKPNEIGQIMILMYHGLDAHRQSAPYMRTVEGFKSDLSQLYDAGFSSISIEDLVNNDIKTPAGRTPVVITFDDGMPTAFSLTENDGTLEPAHNCAVDIMNRFYDEHPDFGRHAVFYVCFDGRDPFKGAGSTEQRFKYLIDHGYELGNHTKSHARLGDLNGDGVQKEIASLDKTVNEIISGYKIRTIAYPYGDAPSKEYKKYALEGEHEGYKYKYDIALRASSRGKSATPNHIDYDALNMPRVRGTNTADGDLGWKLKEYAKHPELRYISDGNPYVISVPIEFIGKVNRSSFKNRILNVYITDGEKNKKFEK
ncbi:MAG: polysaccharide deacetylase family protein [Clostridiales bacterium]|jgi:peptidoglycan/xylan/chitin deacetylase (PgdA/CDA1 family)|nr:polysaccharide deacetylase family protein [Clostridiales bacterium]